MSPCGINKMLTDPRMVSRRLVVEVEDLSGALHGVRQPRVFGAEIGRIVRAVPGLGEHDAEIPSPAQPMQTVQPIQPTAALALWQATAVALRRLR